jgi:hypothetical protein
VLREVKRLNDMKEREENEDHHEPNATIQVYFWEDPDWAAVMPNWMR